MPVSSEQIEAAARAICVARGGDPETMYQHYEYDDYPTDKTLSYHDVTTGEPRKQILHYAWRNHVEPARAALEAALPFLAHPSPPIDGLVGTLAMQLRSHECGCGGACGQRTPAYIAKAADALSRLDGLVERLKGPWEIRGLIIERPNGSTVQFTSKKDRDAWLNAEARLAASERELDELRRQRTVTINDPEEIHAANIHRDLAIARAEAAEAERDEARTTLAAWDSRDLLARLAASDAAVGAMTTVMAKLISTASMLHQNSVGCATNHYDNDIAWHGLPGWLADAQKDIEVARAAISHAHPTDPGANSINKASG